MGSLIIIVRVNLLQNWKSFLTRKYPEWWKMSNIRKHFELTNDIFIKLDNLEIDDSDGETGMLAESCMEIWQNILEHCNDILKKKMFGWFVGHINESVVDYMEEYLEEILFDNFKEEEYLAEKLIFTDQQVRKFKE